MHYFYNASTHSTLVFISFCFIWKLRCSAFLDFLASSIVFPALNSNCTQMKALLKRTAKGGEGEKSGVMIYYHLWKEKGNKLPPALLFLELLKPEEQPPLEMALCKMPICLWIILPLIACSLTTGKNQWERVKVIQQQAICIGVGGWPQTSPGLRLSLPAAPWWILHTSNPRYLRSCSYKTDSGGQGQHKSADRKHAIPSPKCRSSWVPGENMKTDFLSLMLLPHSHP